MIRFTVYGVAQPAGSKNARAIWKAQPDGSRRMMTRPDGSPILTVTDDNPKATSWKQEVRSAAAIAMEGRPLFGGAVALHLTFFMPRLRGHFGSGRNEGVLKPNAPRFHVVKPDVTKLTRCIEDALKGLVWFDDAQVAASTQLKIYADAARVDVAIRSLDATTAPIVEPTARTTSGELFDEPPP